MIKKRIVLFVISVIMVFNLFSVFVSAADTRAVVLPDLIEETHDGVFYLKNSEFSKYMQLDDNATSYMQSNLFTELWGRDGLDYQKWQFVSVGDGYYKILSVISGFALSIPSDAAIDTSLVQEEYMGEARQEWSVTRTSRGTYVLRSKLSDWLCVAAGDAIPDFISNGRNIENRRYTNDTDYRDEWVLEEYTLSLYGITDNSANHDHETELYTIKDNFDAKGLESTVTPGEVSSSDFKSSLQNSNILVSRSHGQRVNHVDGYVYSTYVALENNDNENIVFASHRYSAMSADSACIEDNEDYSNIDLAVFVGCHTGEGGVGARNLPSRIVEQGARTAIGFTGEIYCDEANVWTRKVFQNLNSGCTLEQALSYAYRTLDDLTRDRTIVCGDLSLKVVT